MLKIGQHRWFSPDLARFIMLCLLAMTIVGILQVWPDKKAPTFDWRRGNHIITGVIQKVHPKGLRGQKLVISPTYLQRYEKDVPLPPGNIQVTFRYLDMPLLPGQIVTLGSVLSKPSRPVAPGAYDWQIHMARQGIALIGFGTQKPVIHDNTQVTIATTFARWRQHTSKQLLAHASSPITGAVAVALITGERGYIPHELMQQVRASGLGHLLAISGMHMGMIAGLLFLMAQIACLPFSKKQLPTKTIAALFALIGITTYLLLSGAAIPAQRAWFMATLVLIAVLSKRRAITVWSLGLAALILLLRDITVIHTASFQLSFTAVLTLILLYGRYRQQHEAIWENKTAKRIWLLFLSSLMTGIATAPWALWHFQQFPVYGAFANLAAIPLTGVVIMPGLLLAVFGLPLGLAHVGMHIAGLGIDLLLWIATTTTNMPYSTIQSPSISPVMLVLFLIAGWGLVFMRGRYQVASAIPLCIGSMLLNNTTLPDVVISTDGHSILLPNQTPPVVIGEKRNRFVEKGWQQFYALPVLTHRKLKPTAPGCDDMGCLITVHQTKISMPKQMAAIQDDCARADIIVSPFTINETCAARIIDWKVLHDQGSITLHLNNNNKIKNK